MNDIVTINYRSLRPYRTSYSFGLFLFDLFMLCLTAGHWLIFIWCREMRRNTRRHGTYSVIGWIFDLILLYISFGLWGIWVIFREFNQS